MKSLTAPDKQAGWTIDTYVAHNEAVRVEHEKFEAERDRRYTEVKNAEEKALKIKEEADKTALGLQRETQQYKDEKANELREQINRERVLYATKEDLAAAAGKIDAKLQPVVEYIAAERGRSAGLGGTRSTMQLWIPLVVLILLAVPPVLISLIAVLWTMFGKR